MREHQRIKKESALYGVMRRLGQTLPFADRVIASFKAESVTPERIEGVLFTHDARVPTVFDKKWLHSLDGLPVAGHRIMVKVTARPFLDGTGQVHFLVNNFEVLPDRNPERPVSQDGVISQPDHKGGNVEPQASVLFHAGELPCSLCLLG